MLNLYKLLLSISMACGFIQAIEASEVSREEIRSQNKAYLQKMGITLLDGEVRIIKAKILMAQAKDDYYSSKVQSFLAMHKEQEKNGFVKEPEPRAKELIDFKQAAQYQYKKYNSEFSPSSTHLRHAMSDLKMAYTFVGVPESEIDKNIGVAPYGAYKQVKYGDEGGGWDGAVQFFEKKEIGICEFKEHNLKLAHGGIELIQELVSDEILGKPTIVLVKGNKETGFLYQISWYDNTFSRELSCAAPDFNELTKNNTIELAKTIEKAQ
jgi:hypothetical protein